MVILANSINIKKGIIILGTIMSFVSLALISCKSEKTVPQVEAASMESTIKQVENIDTVGIDYIMGKFNPETHKLFTEIPTKYADRRGLYLRIEALEAYLIMYEAAKAQGILLEIKSATRNFEYQKGIWERKWTGSTILSDGTNLAKSQLTPEEKAKKILEYSSMPGTSRHHWGTDIDLNNFTNSWFENGEGKKIYDWLQNNANQYGFAQVYTPKGKERPHGYQEEKWHWSYLPISSNLLEEAKQFLNNSDIKGFKGSETAQAIDVVGKYVLGVNKACFLP